MLLAISGTQPRYMYVSRHQASAGSGRNYACCCHCSIYCLELKLMACKFAGALSFPMAREPGKPPTIIQYVRACVRAPLNTTICGRCRAQSLQALMMYTNTMIRTFRSMYNTASSFAIRITPAILPPAGKNTTNLCKSTAVSFNPRSSLSSLSSSPYEIEA